MKMKLSVFLLLALLGLSSASRQDRTKGLFGDKVNLDWLSWHGYVPNGAVGIYNHYTRRTDYVCKAGCHAGFYNRNLGPYCNYPLGDKELKGWRFEILTNKDNFAILEWKDGSYGSVPHNAVRTCQGVDIFVGRNKFGLGKVHARHEAFFLPWRGSEYWYKHYEVLAVRE